MGIFYEFDNIFSHITTTNVIKKYMSRYLLHLSLYFYLPLHMYMKFIIVTYFHSQNYLTSHNHHQNQDIEQMHYPVIACNAYHL